MPRPKKEKKISPLHRNIYVEGNIVKICSCILKDSRVIICVPRVKRTKQEWKKGKVRHLPYKGQVIIDLDVLRRMVGDHYKWILKMKKRKEKSDAKT